MNGNTLLLAGGSGFVGKNIAELLNAEYRIVSLDRHIDGEFFARHPGVVTREVDLGDAASVKEIVNEFHPTHVVNLVSIVTAERDLSLFPALVETNLRVLLSLYESLRDSPYLKLFVQFGSAEEYGSTAVAPFSEDARECPDSPYALIKQLTTNTAMMLHRNCGFPAVVVRPGNLFGRHQPKDKLVPYIYDSLVAGTELFLTPGGQKRDFIYIKDFVRALESIMQNPPRAIGSILNVAYGEGIEVRELAEWMKRRLNSSSTIRYGAKEYRKNEIMDFRCNVASLRNRVGFELARKGYEAFEEYIAEMGGTKA